jgi:uncharacterized protein (TIGR03437 family)
MISESWEAKSKMKPLFCWILAAFIALAGAQTISAQTAGSQPAGAHSITIRPDVQRNLAPVGRTTAAAGIIAIGSPLTYGGTNAPDTYSATTTFSSTPVTVDNGAVKIWQVQTPTGSNGEWDVFYMQTTDGGPLAGNINALWNIVIDYTLSAPAYFDGIVQQWLMNGTAVGPLTNGIGSICCAASSNPILPGWSYYASGFSDPLPAGTQTNWQDIYVTPYTLVESGGVDPSTANEFAFAMHFTLQPTIAAVVSASAFGEFPTFAPGSWIEIYGSNLAGSTLTWTSGDFSGVIGPTEIGGASGTSVAIGGLSAFVDYISPLQVNVQVPGGVGTGSQSLILTTGGNASQPFPVAVNATQPGLLAPANFKVGDTQYVVAQESNGNYVLPPGAIPGLPSQRAQPGDTIVIYGIGFGSVTPDIPPGQLVEQLNTLTDTFTISFGGTQAITIPYDGLAPNYMGLYQFDVVVPNVTASDTLPLTFTLGGASGTQTLAIAVGN